ncbi:MAG: tetratricopeptide repeat protein [Acidobacteriota bacterium]|nr:tetratricopeptide repeat protein [Acidobacteriota bacterium]
MTNVARAALVLFLLVFGADLISAQQELGSDSSPDPIAALSRAVREAEQALAQQEIQIAESRYRTALFEGWVLLGSLAEGSGNLVEARSAYEEAITSAVDVRRARIALARVMAELEEFEEAEALLRLLIAENKDDFEARRMLSDTLADDGRTEESIQELEQLVSMNPEDLETAYFLSTAYLANNRLIEADSLLERIVEAIPTPHTHILVGRTYQDYKVFDKARRAFDTAIELDPRTPRAHYYRGTVEVLDPSRDFLELAVTYFEKELEVTPGEPVASVSLGIALSEDRRFEEAIPHLELAAEWPKHRSLALLFLGECLAGVGREEEAIAVFRKGLDAAVADIGDQPKEELPENRARQLASLNFQLAQALRRTGSNESATIHFAAAKEYQSQMTERSREKLSAFLTNEAANDGEIGFSPDAASETELNAEAARELKVPLASTLARAYLDLGVLAARAGRPGSAADLFQHAADLDPRTEQIHYSLGVARFNAGQFEKATEPLRRALEGRPGDAQLEQMLALAWFNSGEYANAAEILENIPGRPSDRRLEYLYGVALVRSERASEAEGVFAQLLTRNTDWPELNVVLAQAHAKQGNFDGAVELLERALELDPKVAEAHGTLGEIHLRKGEIEKAEEELRSELGAHPRDTRTMYTLATVLDLAQKPAEAMTLLHSLLDLEPRLGKGRYLLGKILLAQGSDEDALEQLEAAAGLAPEDPSIHYQLGQAYQKLGRTEDARREFDTFRALKDERRGGVGS